MSKVMEVDKTKVQQFSARIMEDYGNTLRGAMLYIGDQLGLFKALADGEAVTLEQLAQKTGYNARYLREWLGSMVTGSYVTYDAQTRSYQMPAEFVPVLADEDSPYFAGGIIQLSVPFVSMAPKVIEAFRHGGGCAEEAFPLETWKGMERMTMPWYKHYLVQHWIPSLDGVEEKLKTGGSVLDFGCGAGLAAITMAKAYPEARIVGCDFHLPSIELARANAEAAGVGDRVQFEVNDSDALRGQQFDFVTTFVVIHDATDPQQMLKDLRAATAEDGTYLMVELNLSEELHENMNLFGRVMYPQSTLYCMTCSLSHGGAGLGAFMGEKRARQMAQAAGFSHFRKVPSEWPPMPALFELKP
ncbi:class I SAM-dependent methyltransferase [Pseudomonas fluorescens]|jgi:2-polyprenyl-3-methyl-5-hydroxy-6-metoxy-1,4-benzoquinol methylase|uniref:Class I SAM-dependent methyltransferase n=1 Tax=Pseudomonas shahriarae TaxID=2745512 RepID=A0ABT5NAF0_9PSED|nr:MULTISPECIES: methyltransferase domain-containing protein [Pseudomonas]AYG08833.1 class I SAM-dependent methyltransferase [Pseudomonas fluorescens]MDZ4304176.1 methyltransferase domain-containing protein [Pseudomonas sp.]OAE16192.1 SAM-dependent methyltransferase [Pseudomonas brenneri]MBJ2242933.1 methyltransferase domain-containing protein [Pseudomonas sp. MF6768]MBJ2254132.1 methyltransferase domain-containing protein [Pseudomonas sp. MF6784]